MVGYNFSFLLLHISAILTLALFLYIVRMRNKAQIHCAFLFTLSMLFIWSLGHIFEVYSTIMYGYTVMFFVYLYYLGLCFVPVSLLLTSLIFIHTKLKFSVKYLMLFIFPVIDYLVLITNDYHKLYFVKYSIYNDIVELGAFFTIHTLFSYAYILVGLYYFLYFSIKNSGFFSKQSILILLGFIIPFFLNILVTLNAISLPVYFTPITFTFTVICFAFAIFKFKFLNVAPIALQKIVDLISDSYIVVNENFETVDYNQAFVDTFREVVKIKRKDSIIDILAQKSTVDFGLGTIIELNKKAVEGKRTVSFDKHMTGNNFDKHFKIEITPIYSDKMYLGTIILLKDVTQAVKDLETIQENQAILMEQERLASLGQLAGGIAHNLKTPIMSIAGGIEALADLVEEYSESITDSSVTVEDHQEIAEEMRAWLHKMKPYCSYMSDIISTVKGQAVQLNNTSVISFTIDELIKRVDLLMKHELKRYHCTLRTDLKLDVNTELPGDVNSLVQIFDNLIINSIHSYEGKSGFIDLEAKRVDNNIVFTLRDYGKGIPMEVKDRLFKEMITTKGKNGTGLGLYISYSTIKGHFRGNIMFESEEGKGTTFYISIPYRDIDAYYDIVNEEKECQYSAGL